MSGADKRIVADILELLAQAAARLIASTDNARLARMTFNDVLKMELTKRNAYER